MMINKWKKIYKKALRSIPIYKWAKINEEVIIEQKITVDKALGRYISFQENKIKRSIPKKEDLNQN